jgi:ATP-binding cassette, subfamily B, bacterial
MSSFKQTWRSIARRAFLQAKPCRALLLGIVFLDLLTIPLALLLPLPLKLAVDSLTGSPATLEFWHRWLPSAPQRVGTQLKLAVSMMLIVGVLQHVVGFANWLLRTYTGERLVLDFRSRLFFHVQRLSLAYHDQAGAADLTYRLQHDAPAIRDLALNGFLPLINSSLTLAGMLYVTACIDRSIALVALIACPVLYIASRKYSRRMRDEWRDVKDRDSLAMSVVQEVLGALRVVKTFGQEGREHDRFMEHSSRYVSGQLRLATLQGSFYVLVGITLAFCSAAALLLGAKHVDKGLLTVGSLLLVMTYVAKLYEPLGTISSKFVDLQAGLVSLGRAFSVLDESPEPVERSRARAASHVEGAIAFHNVSFRYGLKPALRGVNFSVNPGTQVGICGASGAGKSTLLSLLTRLYDPFEGSIKLDGVDLRDFQIASLRDQFAIVLQEPVLFSTTIAENIAYARPGATRDEVIAAATAARAHDFIMALPQGYDTEVGQRGAMLSGGERQRISLARAFLKDAPVLVMDEPTSALDTRTEAAVVEATRELMRGRTTFVVAHRLSTLESCDVVFRMENGALTQVEERFKPDIVSNATRQNAAEPKAWVAAGAGSGD